MKQCNRCLRDLPLDNFSVLNRRGHLRPSCRKCTAISQRPYKATYNVANRERISEYGRAKYLAKKDRPEFKAHRRQYVRHKLATDPAYKIQHNIRVRIRKTLNRRSAGGRFMALTGASAEFVLCQLTGGAPLQIGSHVDHYIPINHFDLTIEAQCLICFNWRNLRLLPAASNISKHAKLPPDWRERETEIREALSLDAASL